MNCCSQTALCRVEPQVLDHQEGLCRSQAKESFRALPVDESQTYGS